MGFDRCICWRRASIASCASACSRTRAGRTTSRYDELDLLCEPAYLREHGTPRRPEDLSAHRCVNYVSNRTGRIMDWEFVRGGQKVQLTVDGVLAVNDHDAEVAAGLMSFGIVKVANYVARHTWSRGGSRRCSLTGRRNSSHSRDVPAKPSPLRKGAHLRRLVSELIHQDPVFQTR